VSEPFQSILTVEVHEAPECTYVCPAGEFDVAESGRIEREVDALLDAGCPAVVLDMRRLTFIDSSGVHELLRCLDRTQARGSRLALELEPGAVKRALEVCGVLDLFDTRED
jgi:anti-sigma B factor antagonist